VLQHINTEPPAAASISSLGKAALVYAREVRWKVVPLHSVRDGACTCSKGAACRSAGKHPRLLDWTEQASRDPEHLQRWWGQWPDANPGIATGEDSGIWVLDVDPDHGGRDTLNELEAKHGKLPRTAQAMTGSGGEHYFFRWPDGGVSTTASKVGPGLDVRGTGGQVVAAPARSGRGDYRWIHRPWDVPPADAPAWLLARLRRPPARVVIPDAPAPTFPPASRFVLDDARAALVRHGPAPARIDGEGGGQHAVQAAMILTCDFALTDEEAWPLLMEWNARNPTPFDVEADGPEGLRERLRRGRKYAKGEPGTKRKPAIELVAGRLAEIATQAEMALVAARVPIYARGGMLVRPVVEETDAAHGKRTKVARLAKLTAVYARDLLSRHVRFQRFDAKSGGPVTADPPADVAETILGRVGEWRFNTIAGVITTPTMRPDGTILDAAGFDPATRLVLMSPPEMPPIPEAPTKDDARAALALLAGLLTEFPFVDDASRSVALSGIITPVVRGAFAVAPGHVASASTPGTGKSFLWDVAAAPSMGQPMPVIAAGRTEEETEKRLGAAVIAGQPLVSLDNVNGGLGGDALCQIIERPIVEVRVLGLSELRRIESRATIYATGNNIQVMGDATRRVLVSRLDANMEQPHTRQFKRDPLAEVLADRGRYVAAALTVVRAYIVAGRPDKAPRLASFGDWSDTVRSALIWLGCSDPVATMERAREDDPLLAIARAVFGSWAAHVGTGLETARTAADLLEMADVMPPAGSVLAAFKEAIYGAASNRGRPDTRTLGKWLSRHKGRIIGGHRLESLPNNQGAKWWLDRV